MRGVPGDTQARNRDATRLKLLIGVESVHQTNKVRAITHCFHLPLELLRFPHPRPLGHPLKYQSKTVRGFGDKRSSRLATSLFDTALIEGFPQNVPLSKQLYRKNIEIYRMCGRIAWFNSVPTLLILCPVDHPPLGPASTAYVLDQLLPRKLRE